MKPTRSLALAATLCTIALSSASAATFTNAGAFASATTNIQTETFDDNIAQPGLFGTPVITFDNGTTSTARNTRQFNRVTDGVFIGGTRAGRDDSFDNTIIFDFDRQVTAFGADFIGAAEIMISGMFDGQTQSFLLGDLRSEDGFVGLTSSTAFSTITFSTDAGGFLQSGNHTVSVQAKNFRLDNLALGDAAPGDPMSPVPLPASALMLLSALGGFGALRKIRQRS